LSGGGWGKAENKAKLSPAGAGSWVELGNCEKVKKVEKEKKAGAELCQAQLKLGLAKS
jgi:hypothetical protein